MFGTVGESVGPSVGDGSAALWFGAPGFEVSAHHLLCYPTAFSRLPVTTSFLSSSSHASTATV